MKQSGAGKEVHKGKVTSSESDNSTLLRLLTFVIHTKIIEGLDRSPGPPVAVKRCRESHLTLLIKLISESVTDRRERLEVW